MPDITKGGLDARGLDQAIRGLVRANPRFKPEAIKVMRKGAKKMQAVARGRIGSGGNRLKTNKRMIGRYSTPTGAGIDLRASTYPWALQAEFGERWANIPINLGTGTRGGTRVKRQSQFKRRTAPRLRQPTSPNLLLNKGGYMVQPTIRLMTPKLIDDAGKEIMKLITKELKRGK